MKIRYDMSPPINIRNFLTKIGYHSHYDYNTKKESYSSPLGGAYYPRFHIYVADQADGSIIIDLHLDQKKARYEGQKAHMAESDSEVVREEGQRIMRWLAYVKTQ